MSAFFCYALDLHIFSLLVQPNLKVPHRAWASIRPVLLVGGGKNWLCHFHFLGVLLRDLGCRWDVGGLCLQLPTQALCALLFLPPFSLVLPISACTHMRVHACVCVLCVYVYVCMCVSPSLSLSGASEVSRLAPKSLWNPSSLKQNLGPYPHPFIPRLEEGMLKGRVSLAPSWS